MLGRKRKRLEDLSFAIDVIASVGLVSLVFWFLKQHAETWQRFLQTVTGYPFYIQGVTHLQDQGWLFRIMLFNLFLALKMIGFYNLDVFTPISRIPIQSLKGVFLGTGLTAIIFNFLSIVTFNRSLLFGFALLFVVYLIVKELLFRVYLTRRYYKDRPLQALLVCPAEEVEQQLSSVSLRHLSSLAIKGIILTTDWQREEEPSWKPLIAGKLDKLEATLARGLFDLVFLGDMLGQAATAQRVLAAAEEQGVEVWYLADFLTPLISRPVVDEYGGRPVIVFRTTRHTDGRFLIKRLFDLMLATLMFGFVSPVWLLVALIVKFTSKGPVIYCQERTGWKGKPFRMYKFRTMVYNADTRLDEVRIHNEIRGPVFKSSDDPRVTWIGRVLRRFSFDELPQLLNVLKGDMSLVGPRHLPLYETENFGAFKDYRRYSVLPGLTGLWQVSGRNRIEDFSDWVRLDLEYIDSWSLWLDIVILFRTIPVILSGDGAR